MKQTRVVFLRRTVSKQKQVHFTPRCRRTMWHGLLEAGKGTLLCMVGYTGAET